MLCGTLLETQCDNVFATHNGSLFLLFHWTCILIITATTPQQAAGNYQVKPIKPIKHFQQLQAAKTFEL